MTSYFDIMMLRAYACKYENHDQHTGRSLSSSSKRKAEEKGVTLGEVISEAAFVAYRDRPSKKTARPFELPVAGRGGLMAGVDLDSSSALEDVMDGFS